MNGTKVPETNVPGTKVPETNVPGTKYVYDTCVAIFLLDDDERLLSIRQDLENGEKYVSVINRIELFAKPDITGAEIEGIIDTNVFVSSLIQKSYPYRIRRPMPLSRLSIATIFIL
ncbi:hypothetical protein FACS189493_4810 [Spirochaetia bacterium]|nr:hypothetical protein FACS189493_4810 [Spirochaetia bacterium]